VQSFFTPNMMLKIFGSTFLVISLWQLMLTSSSLTNKVHIGDCLLTAHSVDGFGHQYEAKMSCYIASVLNPKFTYVHVPIDTLEHGISPSYAEEFTGMAFETLSINQTSFQSREKWTKHNAYWLFELMHKNMHKCESDKLYVLDNCWDVIYFTPMVERLYEVKSELQRKYLSTPKPDTGFNERERNIVIHIRRGDASLRSKTPRFYAEAIHYFQQQFNQPVFWVNSDDPHWDQLPLLAKDIPPDHFHMPTENTSLWLDFHRMVMADGLVISESSLAYAAVLLTNATTVITTPQHKVYGHIGQWLRFEPYHVLYTYQYEYLANG